MQQLRSMQDIIADLNSNKGVFDNMADSLTEFSRVMPTENTQANVQYMQRQARACQQALDILNKALTGNGNGDQFHQITDTLEAEIDGEIKKLHPETT